jgi:hypothetical protein
LEDYEEEG